MATLKYLVESHKPKQDGTFRVKVRITHQSVVKYITTAIYVTTKQLKKNFDIKDDTYILPNLFYLVIFLKSGTGVF